jgi:hypothetical protein
MKELRHIRRSRERWQARRAARAAWWKLQEPVDSYGMRVWLDWARSAVEPEVEHPLESYVRRMNRDYWRKELGLA